MQAIGGLVTLGNLVLSLVLAMRLLRLSARTQGPERWLGFYFLFAIFLGTIVVSVVYMSWADPTLALPGDLGRVLHATGLAFSSFGFFGILRFTQQVFRPQSALARRSVSLGAVLLVASYVGVGATEGFAVHIVNGPAYWVGFAVRLGAMVWMASESLLYWSRQRRRLRLGLADPVLVNRFLLWGVWASSMALTMLSDPGARLYYWHVTGTTDTWLVAVGEPIIVAMIAVSSLLGVVSGTTLLLTFFPTAGYRRWIAARDH